MKELLIKALGDKYDSKSNYTNMPYGNYMCDFIGFKKKRHSSIYKTDNYSYIDFYNKFKNNDT